MSAQMRPYARIRQDLFACIDIVAMDPGTHTLWGIQVTSGSNHAARRAKARQIPALTLWLSCGARFAIWSYSKTGARGKRKLWTLREEELT